MIAGELAYKSWPSGQDENTMLFDVPFEVRSEEVNSSGELVEPGYYNFPCYYANYHTSYINPFIDVLVRANGMAVITMYGAGKIIEDYLNHFENVFISAGIRKILSSYNKLEVSTQWVRKEANNLISGNHLSCKLSVTVRMYQGDYVHWRFPKFLTPVMALLDYIRLVMCHYVYKPSGDAKVDSEFGVLRTTKLRNDAAQMQLFKKHGGEAMLRLLAYSKLYFYSSNYGPNVSIGDLIFTNPATLAVMRDFKSNEYNGGNILVPQQHQEFRQALHASKLSILCPPTTYFDRELQTSQESF